MRLQNILLSVALTAATAIGGCAIDADDTAIQDVEVPERRQKIGKADLWGSCLTKGPEKNFCGKKAPVGNCYCDKACVEMGDCCSDYGDACSAGETEMCADIGGSCMSDPIDVTFPAKCGDIAGMKDGDGLCPAFNQACCVPDDSVCQPVLCKLACQWGFEKNDEGCEICSCADGPIDPPAASCENKCGGAAPGKVCYCDAACEGYGDCCDDYDDTCGDDREPASGMCVKNSNDACTTDADCTAGGCGGELCYNPASGAGFSTCECTTPAPGLATGCGCVNGSCTWWK